LSHRGLRPAQTLRLCNIALGWNDVVQGDKLAGVLSEFARTMITDFPIQRILDHLVERIVDVLPVTAAGVTLIDEELAPRYIAASDQNALRFERLQSTIGQGPCLAAYESGEAVSVPDLANDSRFPRFGPAAVEAGLAAVFTFPLLHGNGRLGALDLYREMPGPLQRSDLDASQTLADVAAAYLINAQAREELRETSDRFHHHAQHDPLTGLPNRMMLQDRLDHAAQRAQRSNANAAIIFADLDRFKQVNDTYGHLVGDELLLAVARRLQRLVRPGDTVARVSGDDFVFLSEDLSSPDDVKLLAQRIDKAFVRPFVVASFELPITASVGVAFAGPGQDISERLVMQADAAMYQAKRNGGAGHQIIDLRTLVLADDGDNLEVDLRAAFDNNGLRVDYQPIVRSADGRVSGVEALLRWDDPDRGSISAATIVALAEQSDLISDIGAWVLERACLDHALWLREHPDTALDLSVNMSGRQLMRHDFFARVAGVLDSTAMDPRALVLEMTEDIIIEDTERAIASFNALRELGVRIALDDFGTGYSSLSYLLRLPVNILKIDQSFIAGIGHPQTGAVIVSAVTNLAHSLDLTVVAEGVETRRQHESVARIGCDFAQGYYYAAPMPAGAISTALGSPGTTATNHLTPRLKSEADRSQVGHGGSAD
jgi:diguanylate cyclase (GGDEF)-like protein